MSGEMTGKVVMITGATGGLGSGVVQRFREAGASLALVARSAEEASALVSGAFGVGADVTDPASVQAAVDQIAAHYGRIDALVHTVGGYASSKTTDVDLAVWDKMMNLNARSVLVTAGTVANFMLKQQMSGSIVVVLARNALDGTKNHAAYSASKAAAQRILQSLSKELIDQGIRVNGVIPGTIDTPANRESTPNADFSRWVTPAQIAEVILFLTSEASSPINGDSLTVYGRS
ncbi:MAG: SDR family NAD(P)-dependent oxidoreductase [Anaerolineae bacterium]|nr:SDR family NAD(P)-dependent oxidoreductase [Anaerolineae bacterium]